MKNYLLLVSLFISTLALAQPASVMKANAAYESGKYFETTELAVKAYNSISPKNDRALLLKSSLAYKAAYSFDRILDNEKAIEWYQRAIDLKYYEQNPYVYFRIGNIYKKEGKYDKASVSYEEFLKLVPTDQQVKNALGSLKNATVMKDNRKRYTVKSETKINTKGMEMAPAIANRLGTSIVFGSTRPSTISGGTDPITGEGYFNIWEAERDRSGNWTAPKLFEADSINTEQNEGTLAFDGRFRHVYITRCPSVKKKDLGCQIWMAEKKGRSFSYPELIPLAPRDSFSVGHPCPNDDGTVLIFSSDIPGGFGGKDLWYSKYDRRGNSWTKPVNLGPKINTGGDELFPTYAKNGDLLFASNGIKGLGGLDIYRAPTTEKEMEFGDPVNLGSPINSDANDYQLIEMDNKTGYFTSNREGSLGTKNNPDIWSYELPPNLFDLKVILSVVGGEERIAGATVQITPEKGEVFTGTTNDEGIVFWDKKPDGSRYINEETDYSVQIMPMEGFHPSDKVEDFTTKGLEYDQNFILEMSLIPKKPIVLPEVRYDYNSDILQVNDSVNSKDSLNFVYEMLQEYPGMVLKLVSNSDARGNDKYNQKLSERRAQSCVNYLVEEKGVNPNRLKAEGNGEDVPRIVYLKDDKYYISKPSGDFEAIKLTEKYINQFKTSNKDLFERLHQFNRRTEADVLRMDFVPEAKATPETETTEPEKESDTEEKDGE